MISSLFLCNLVLIVIQLLPMFDFTYTYHQHYNLDNNVTLRKDIHSTLSLQNKYLALIVAKGKTQSSEYTIENRDLAKGSKSQEGSNFEHLDRLKHTFRK